MTFPLWNLGGKNCIVRESNPGRPRGRRAFYHWTNDASTLKGSNLSITICNFLLVRSGCVLVQQVAVCSCGRVVKATHSKWVSLWERRFESYQLREIKIFYKPKDCCNHDWNIHVSCHTLFHIGQVRPCGLMDKAPDFGSGDCRFESCHGRLITFLLGFLHKRSCSRWGSNSQPRHISMYCL